MPNWLPELKESSRNEWLLAAGFVVTLVFIIFSLISLIVGSPAVVWEWFVSKENYAVSIAIVFISIPGTFTLALFIVTKHVIVKKHDRNFFRKTLASDGSIPPVIDITVLIGSPDFDLQVFVQKFRKCRTGETSIDGLTEDEEGLCPLTKSDGFFKILKYDLSTMGFEKGDPYKFYCHIQNDRNTIDRCYALLCRQGYIVTGEGEPDADDEDFYKVWFVSGREATYPEPVSLFFLNNKF